MYYYIYDTFLEEKRFARFVNEVEAQINALGLTGERTQASSLRSVGTVTKDAIERNRQPIVIVGSDASLSQAIDQACRMQTDVALAYIPVDDASFLARALGVTASTGVTALSRRVVLNIRAARVNEYFFVGQVRCSRLVENRGLRLRRKNALTRFKMTARIDDALHIHGEVLGCHVLNQPQEALLKLDFLEQDRGRRQKQHAPSSSFSSPALELTSKTPFETNVDGRRVVRSPLIITTTKVHVPLIVGRDRLFS